MEFREVLSCSLKLILVCQILSLTLPTAEGQLDLPGPPYPDLRGQNRWGVKFDPRKHGPPYDKRVVSQSQHHYRRHSRRHPQSRPRRRPHRVRDVDSFWSPDRIRSHRDRRVRSQRDRANPYYGNDLKVTRPQNYMKALEDYEPASPITEKEQKFWNSWNSWYKKQADAKVKGHALPSVTKTKEEDIEVIIDLDDLKSSKVLAYKSKHKHGKDCPEGSWKKSRDYYLGRMKGLYSGLKSRAKSLVTFDDVDDDEEDYKKTKDSDSGGEESWRIFTAIGKGMDAANVAMRGVRKTVGRGVIGTGVKYGKKMVVDSVMNVGTSALSTALRTAAFG